MQVERIRALADLIEQQPHTSPLDDAGFNMEAWTHACGTPCCIAGWAKVMSEAPQYVTEWNAAEEWLGLTGYQSADLFVPVQTVDRLRINITPSHAAAVLRHLADHGVVDWTVGVSA